MVGGTERFVSGTKPKSQDSLMSGQDLCRFDGIGQRLQIFGTNFSGQERIGLKGGGI
jgi:hypothetical protein